jgi:hypothetical protein
MTESFAPPEPGRPTQSQVPVPPPPVIAPAKKGDRTFRILLAVAALVAVGGVTFAVGRVTAPAAAASTRGGFGAGGFAGGAGAAGTGAGGGLGRGGFGGGVLITGTVDSISGTTMTLKEANGTSVIVNLAGTTTYHAQAASTSAAVTAGKQVQVQVQLTGGFGGGTGGGAEAPGASPAAGGGTGGAAGGATGGTGTTTRTVTATDVTLVTP